MVFRLHKPALLIFLNMLFLSHNSFAAPSIDTVDGITGHGESVTISGTDFQERPDLSGLSWLGDYIESRTGGDTADHWPPHWERLNNTWPDVYFDSRQAHSGNLSLRPSRPADGSYPEPYTFIFPEGQLAVYVTY